MPWYQTVLLLGGVALSLMILIRPNSDGRSMAFTLLIGAVVLLTIGLLLKELTTGSPSRLGSSTKAGQAARFWALALAALSGLRCCLIGLEHAQPVDAVERGHLIALRQGRIIEHRIDEVVDFSTER